MGCGETLRNENKDMKIRLEVSARTHVVPESRQTMGNSKYWEQKWLSKAMREWDREVEGFREHIAIHGSLKWVSGRDAACV